MILISQSVLKIFDCGMSSAPGKSLTGNFFIPGAGVQVAEEKPGHFVKRFNA